jgi:hypothetical protein
MFGDARGSIDTSIELRLSVHRHCEIDSHANKENKRDQRQREDDCEHGRHPPITSSEERHHACNPVEVGSDA